MLFEQIHDRGCVANIHVAMLVLAHVRDQVVARFLRGSFSAEKLCAHIVVDAGNARAIACEALYALGTNQSRRTCDDDGAHQVIVPQPFLTVGTPGILPGGSKFGRRDARLPHRQDACATIPQSSMSLRPRKDSPAQLEIAGRPRAHARLAVDFSTPRRETKSAGRD